MHYFCVCIFVKAVGTGHNNHNVFSPVEVSQVQYFLHKVLLSFYGMPLYFVRNQMLMFFYYWQNEMDRSSLQHGIPSFSCISEMFYTSFPGLFCHFLSFMHCPLVHIWKTWKFSKFFQISPFFFNIGQFNFYASHYIPVYSGQNLLQDFLHGPISGRYSLFFCFKDVFKLFAFNYCCLTNKIFHCLSVTTPPKLILRLSLEKF